MASLPASLHRTSPISLPAVLLLLLLLHAAAIALFTRGFLLTRVELSVRSTPADRTAWRSGTGEFLKYTDGGEGGETGGKKGSGEGIGRGECGIHGNDGDRNSQRTEDFEQDGGGLNALYDKVVIVVIDAARFDFVANTTSYNQGRPGSWIGRLKAVGEIVKSMGHGAALFRFTADPPTTSLQRIKGLTTGGLPTFIDVGSSFGSYTITEDNLLFQLLSVGRRLEMMGDDTWLDVFPSAFNRSTPFPSLVVKDIHTVDDGVLANIFPALNRDDWDLLIGHFLGVDHVGHTFAVDSPIMDTKLDQMNQMMLDVVAAMKAQAHRGGRHERSLLLFMSDHGQTLTGDHGGGTPEEAHAFLLAVSMQPPPHPLPAFLSACPSPVRPTLLNQEQAGEKDMAQRAGGGEKECFEELPQIDFTPTLSVLLGAPIPFASVGKVNPHMLALSPAAWEPLQPPAPTCNHTELNLKNRTEEGSKIDPAVRFLSRLSSALMMNAWQVHRYLSRYSNEAPSPFPHQPFTHLKQLYTHAQSTATPLLSSSRTPSRSSSLISSIQAHLAYLDGAAALARSQWTHHPLPHSLTPSLPPCLTLPLPLSPSLPHSLPTSLPPSHAAIAPYLGCRSFSLLTPLPLRDLINLGGGTRGGFPAGHVSTASPPAVPCGGQLEGRCAVRFSIDIPSAFSSVALAYIKWFIWGLLSASSQRLAHSLGSLRLAQALLSLPMPPYPFPYLRFFCRFLSKILLIRASPAAPVAGGSKHEGSGKSRKKKKDGVVQTAEKAPEFEQQHNGLVSMPQQLPGYGVRQQQQAQEQKLGRTLIHLIGLFGVPIILVGGRSIPVILLLGALQGMLFLSLSHSHASVPSFILCCVEWSLLSFLLFFASGHACTFDGLRYTAAFTGFNDFQYHRQGGLLALDTFGFSHLIPALAIPLLALLAHPRTLDSLTQISMKAFLLFLFPRVMATFTTTAFVAGMRRHLMVIKQQH
ncbi:unnamed protein product [Closterium sp. NIES-65]|nr:unnamed protein product [Closterium sp. NIES-65]